MKILLNLLAFLTLLITFSRGFIEIATSNIVAYGLQMVFASIFLVVLIATNVNNLKSNFKINLLYFLSFFLFSSISAMITSFSSGFYLSWFYVIVMNFYIFLFFVSTSFDIKNSKSINFHFILSMLLVTLVLVGFLQQLQIINFLPGITLYPDIRPSSLTGSYLHYPLILSFFVFYFIQSWVINKKLIDLVLTFLSLLAVITSYSRSGMLLIAVGIGFYLIFNKEKKDKKVLKLSMIIIVGFVLIMVNLDNVYVQRLLSSLSFDGLGNAQRFNFWVDGIKMWMETNVLFGSYTGQVTNLTNNITNTNSTIVESGVIQQLLNFGLIGTVIFYLFFYFIFQNIDQNLFWIKAFVVAAVIQSFAYQSIEVFPFMFIISLLPIVSKEINTNEYQIEIKDSRKQINRNEKKLRFGSV